MKLFSHTGAFGASVLSIAGLFFAKASNAKYAIAFLGIAVIVWAVAYFTKR